MSKRNSNAGSPGSNTLFKYFAKSPSAMPSTPKNNSATQSKDFTPKSVKIPNENIKRSIGKVEKQLKNEPKNDDDGKDEEDDEIKQKPKRRRIIVDSDSDDSDHENENKINSMNSTKRRSPPSTPTLSKKKTKSDNNTISLEDKLKNIKPEKLDEIDKCEDESQALIDEPVVWAHNKLEFIKPNKIKDANGRKPSDSDYDPTTLSVPASFLESLTPAMRQWWEIKSQNFDSVLFFKVGKFYELYHMDADVGVQELGFTYMRGEFAHSGFPEQSYDRMAVSLVEKGYKIARIEQTETPDMMQERVKHQQKKVTKFDKVVKREVCQITNRGTQVFGQQVPLTNNHQPNYMLAVAECHSAKSNRFGVCFIDTSLGDFHIGEFDDDKHCSRLLTLLSHNPPVLVLSERNGLSIRTNQIFKTVLSNTLKEQLLPETQFLTAEKTLKIMAENYFSSPESSKIEWPDLFKLLHDDGDHLGLTPNSKFALSLRALGACLWYMTKCLVDQQIVSMAQFTLYIPPDNLDMSKLGDLEKSVVEKVRLTNSNRNMVLDSITLLNLKITDDEMSLLSTLDNCCTKFGKRLMRHWVCTPSCEKSIIVDRQEAVKELMADGNLLQELRLLLGALPDLERQLAQIHTFGNDQRSKTHPDGRAIFFEQKIYNKKKIKDFISTLDALDSLTKLPQLTKNCTSQMLISIGQCAPKGKFPCMESSLEFFKTGFNHEEALKDGVIAPGKGVDEEFDATEKEIENINDELADYLKQQEKRFGCRIVYFGNDKKRFQLEIPESNAKRADSSYILEGQKKGSKPVKRYHTEETKDFLKRMLNAEDQRNIVLRDLSRRMFEKFSSNYSLWKKCVDLVAVLDVLTALAVYGQNQSNICFPEIVDNSNEPILEIEDGYHPCLKLSEDLIPNGITLGGTLANLALLTGPNMGGKSTLMRQVGLLVIMSQIGAPIPATCCRLSLIDRIFTRLGAQDDIMAGHSTFLVELNETSAILKHATINSLVLLDELGRGTATYDGTAIAAAVVNFLADLKCRTLFSTHYHNLVDNFHDDLRISLGHMACMVENEDNDDPTQETVTFLYKYSDGACPKSYGFNAAKLAGMPNSIIKRAHELSKKVEATALNRKLFSKLLSKGSIEEIKDLLKKVKACKI